MTKMSVSVAPWTDREVRNLAECQRRSVAPFACVCSVALEPTRDGWICPACGKARNWCWTVMADGSWLHAMSVLAAPHIDLSVIDEEAA